MERQIHGGNIYDKDIRLDYSVNINPLGMPESVTETIRHNICKYATYPDICYRELKKAIADKEHILTRHIVCGNGASELIMASVRAAVPKTCAIAAPSFSGYERAVRAYGADIVYYNLDVDDGFGYGHVCSQLKNMDIQMCFICNPNNPTGNIIPDYIIKDILDICARRNIIVIVDECFLRFHPDYEKLSCKRLMGVYDNLVIISAFTKFYAMAGIRLGYMMSDNQIFLAKVSDQLPEWNVSGVAQQAGIEAVKDDEYEIKTRQIITQERSYLMKELSAMGCMVYPSEADYITFRLPVRLYGYPLFTELIKHNILIRSCESYNNMPSDCYRIAVKLHTDNEELIEILRQLIS